MQKKLVWGMALTLASALLFYIVSWLSEPQARKAEIEKPSLVAVVPLNDQALSSWRETRDDQRFLAPESAVIVVGRQLPVWIYNWIYIEKGKSAAFSFLDWLSEESGGDIDEWLKERNYPSLGEIRRWNEDNRELVSAKLGEAEKKALSMEGAFSEQNLKIFGSN